MRTNRVNLQQTRPANGASSRQPEKFQQEMQKEEEAILHKALQHGPYDQMHISSLLNTVTETQDQQKTLHADQVIAKLT